MVLGKSLCDLDPKVKITGKKRVFAMVLFSFTVQQIQRDVFKD